MLTYSACYQRDEALARRIASERHTVNRDWLIKRGSPSDQELFEYQEYGDRVAEVEYPPEEERETR